MKKFSELSDSAKEKGLSFASTFGEKAAGAFGDKVQHTLQQAVLDLKPIIEDSANKSSLHVKEGLEIMAESLKITGIEGFTEWGFAMERGMAQLGKDMECGFINGVRQINYSVQQQIEKSTNALGKEIAASLEKSSVNVSKIGIEQFSAFKKVFETELYVLQCCIVVFTVSMAIIALSCLFQLSPFREIYEYIAQHFSLILFFAFALLAALSIKRDDFKYPFLIIGGGGFFIGNLVQRVTFASLNTFILIIVFVLFVLLIQRKTLVFLYRQTRDLLVLMQEYRDFKKSRTLAQ